ncbi:MAG: hypothetical protein GYB64_19560, partial [Chloroflexi bacterium]|nr:hypothetical protein [Chloroflexota bacterium]
DALAQIACRHPETLPDAVAALEPLAASDHRWLRVAVLQALAEMARSDERAAPAAVHGLLAALVRAETQAVYELTLETLLAIGPNARPALEEATRSAPPEQRDQARYAYARLL